MSPIIQSKSNQNDSLKPTLAPSNDASTSVDPTVAPTPFASTTEPSLDMDTTSNPTAVTLSHEPTISPSERSSIHPTTNPTYRPTLGSSVWVANNLTDYIAVYNDESVRQNTTENETASPTGKQQSNMSISWKDIIIIISSIGILLIILTFTRYCLSQRRKTSIAKQITSDQKQHHDDMESGLKMQQQRKRMTLDNLARVHSNSNVIAAIHDNSIPPQVRLSIQPGSISNIENVENPSQAANMQLAHHNIDPVGKYEEFMNHGNLEINSNVNEFGAISTDMNINGEDGMSETDEGTSENTDDSPKEPSSHPTQDDAHFVIGHKQTLGQEYHSNLNEHYGMALPMQSTLDGHGNYITEGQYKHNYDIALPMGDTRNGVQ